MDLFANLIIGMGYLLLAQVQPPHAPADSPPAPASSSTSESPRCTDRLSPWYIILNGPQDVDELWRKLEHPDLMVIKGDRAETKADRDGPARGRNGSTAWLVESVKVRGQVAGDFASLTIELVIVVKGAEPVWVPIRLDGQRLTGAGRRS